MGQALKTKKNGSGVKKIKPGGNDKKALSPFFKKKRPGTAKEIVGRGTHPARKEMEAGLEKTRKELAVIKKNADEASKFAENIIDTVREPLLALDQDLRIVKVSRSFYDFFKVKPEETVGQLIYDLGNKQWDIPKLRELLENILPQKASFDNFEVEHEFATIGWRVMLLNAREIQQVLGRERIILLAIEDITEHKRLEILLMESEQLYHGVFETASDGIVLLEKQEGKIFHVNPAAEKILGYSKKECIGNKLQDIGFMLDLGDFQTTMQNLNKNGIINYEDVPVKTKSGQHIDTDIYLVDKTKVVQCNIRDITDRTRAEEALRKSENNFRRSLDDSPLGVRIVTPKGETIYANRAILDLYGYDGMEEINRIPLKERYTPQSYTEFQTRKKDRERDDFGPSEYEINIVRKNKEIRHLLVMRKEVLWNGSKQFQVIYQDITERKRAEVVLRINEGRYRVAEAIGHVGSWEYNPQSTKFWGSDEAKRIYGFNPEALDFSTNEVENCIPEQERVHQALVDLIEADKPYNLEFEIHPKNSLKPRIIFSVAELKRDKHGNPLLVTGIIQDITERKRAEDSIRSSLIEKEILLKEVHHRVKNNLMIIIGLIKMEETKANNEMFNPLLQELDGRIRSMAQVHEGFYKSADLAHIDLQNYIETMGAQISAQFGADRNIRFSVQAVGVEVGLDVAVPCGLILNELITNAYKHAFPGNRTHSEQGNCEINVSVNQEGNMNVVAVTNNGVGLPADLDWEKSDTLGLRLIKMLSQQINGSIELDRSAGTAFRLKFPVA
jgi:PAS domain S-box-containing protein